MRAAAWFILGAIGSAMAAAQVPSDGQQSEPPPNCEGFGSTTSLDFDHVLRRGLLLRWGNVGELKAMIGLGIELLFGREPY